MIFNVSGGGGTALNFRVVGGTTAPSNPKENTIWVNTSTPITSWVFSATQPTGATGKVWISTDTSSQIAFNALKKNGIQVYPISAKQYVSGAWVDKTVKSWQGGKWVDWWNGELYKYGNEYVDITGGWNAVGTTPPTVTRNADNMVITQPRVSGSRSTGSLRTKNAIDVTNFKKAMFRVSGSDGRYTFVTLKAISEASGNVGSSTILCEGGASNNIALDAYELNISTLSSKYFIEIEMGNGDTSGPMPLTVYEIYLTT